MKFGFYGSKLPIKHYPEHRTVMYETHFGLKKKPFRALAAGSDVFVGPQTATTIAGLNKALTAPDSIVAVSGPTGSGKTTLVRRALDAISDQQLVITIGRIHLGHDEVLELLLEEMGAEMPTGTVQRFTAFRRLLNEQKAKGSRIFVVVEDAARVGIDALSELEALTAIDAGVSDGANIVLMGDESLEDLLDARRLVRLKQRLKLRQRLVPLSARELTAYFKHCFRLAGNEFDTIFEPGTVEVLHALSGGIPRMANNLVESALVSAAENKQGQVGVATIKLVATEEFGLDTGVKNSEQDALLEVAREVPSDLEEAETPVVEAQAPVAEVKTPLEEIPAPAEPFLATPDVAGEERVGTENAMPELIRDTLPDLAILAPALANPPAIEETSAIEEPPVEQVIETATVEEAVDEPILTLSDSVDGEIPPWEKDPTLAQLRPDLDALEHAIAVAQGTESDEGEETEQPSDEENIPELVPEITLDREIQAKIDEAAELLKKAEEEEVGAKESESDEKVADKPTPAVEAAVASKAPVKVAEPPLPEPSVVEPPVVETFAVAEDACKEESPKANPEREKIAVNLAQARTIDDCDDKMAETLFGEDFSKIATQVAPNAPAEMPSCNDLDATVTNIDGGAAVNVETKSAPMSASQRLRTVHALNANSAVISQVRGKNQASPPAPPIETTLVEHPSAVNEPQSIEDQINTSMTQTLRALSDKPDDIEDDDEDGKGGFFSRFRRS